MFASSLGRVAGNEVAKGHLCETAKIPEPVTIGINTAGGEVTGGVRDR
jgi:hypothetical protein